MASLLDDVLCSELQLPFEPDILRELRMDIEVAQKFLLRILRMFNRRETPVFVGSMALEAGVSIAKGKLFAEHLERHGLIRRLSSKEAVALGFHETSEAYVLIGKAKPMLASD